MENNQIEFNKVHDGNYMIRNKKEEYLGYLQKRRVGAWMTWCLFLNEDCYMTAGCLDEIRGKIKELNRSANKKEK